MIRRSSVLTVRALVVAGLAVVPLGCSDSATDSASTTSGTPVVQSVPEPSKPLTAQEKKAQQREFDNMGVKEKREWRRQQREAAGGSATAPSGAP